MDLRQQHVERVDTALATFLARAGRWRATEVREHLVPTSRNIVLMPELAASLDAYDALLGNPRPQANMTLPEPVGD